MIMEYSFIPSLQHLCCTKIIVPLFEEVLPYIEVYWLRTSSLLQTDFFALNMDPDKAYDKIYNIISGKIKSLIPCIPLQKKLQSFIAPLFCEIEDFLKCHINRWSCGHYTQLTILKSIPRCWSANGSIDREKVAKIFVKNKDLGITNRFLIACNYCLLDDVLDIWKDLSPYKKAFLRHHADVTVAIWIQWLESSSKKDVQSFIKWSIQTEFCNRNVYNMKYVFKTLNSVEKRLYLTNTLTKSKVSSDIMGFGLSLMTRDEQEQIFKKSPVEVFKCIMSWPMRDSFSDIVDILMTYLTCDTFCDILNMLLLRIKNQKGDYPQFLVIQMREELLVILKKFWAKSPLIFKNFANSNSCISESLQIVLDFDFIQDFPTQQFLSSFDFDYNIWLMSPFVI